MPIVRELTMYCKCQLDHLIPLKCVCVKPIVGVLENHTGALMKFFLDCNDYRHRRASFEGLKESTVFLNVKLFVELKDGTVLCGAGGVKTKPSPLGGSGDRKKEAEME